jgi:hypothetical protein
MFLRVNRVKKTAMTVIVGLLCRHGLAITSDSQESDEDLGVKRLNVRKVYDTSHFGPGSI